MKIIIMFATSLFLFYYFIYIFNNYTYNLTKKDFCVNLSEFKNMFDDI